MVLVLVSKGEKFEEQSETFFVCPWSCPTPISVFVKLQVRFLRAVCGRQQESKLCMYLYLPRNFGSIFVEERIYFGVEE